MASLKITELNIPEVKIIEPTYFEDFRYKGDKNE